jgi:hypothetical protein
MTWTLLPLRAHVARLLTAGSLASAVSMAVMAGGSRRDTGSAVAALNAPSHWFWGDRALRRNDASWRFTLLGVVTHHASAIFWAVFYELLRACRQHPTPGNAVVDAVAVTAVAAVVDLKFVPQRLTPGFERRLSRRNLAWVYVGFAAGLALGGVLASRGARHERR